MFRCLASLFAVSVLTGYAAIAAADLGDCSQPVSTQATPAASDCLFILQVAISIQACTPEPCVCDPNGDGTTTASDALTCLNKAVGGSVEFLCPCESNCTDDSNCFNDDCVCSDCDDDLFCSDPGNCNDNGECDPFSEGCVCADCAAHPECVDN
jgi:hypothetical protein